jgi:hypothetical protein
MREGKVIEVENVIVGLPIIINLMSYDDSIGPVYS